MKKSIGMLLFTSFSCYGAVNLSPNHVGEVLLVPYFTVNNKLNTLVSVTNTSELSKAVKLVFKDGNLGQSIGSVNIYLAPNDVWSFALARGEEQAQIISNDHSCTPSFNSPMSLTTSSGVSGNDNDVNLFEGAIEIYEMGALDPETGFGRDMTFVDDKPVDCGQIAANWEVGGIWREDNPNSQLLEATGGLVSSISLVDVSNGIGYGYDAVAINDFYPADTIIHSNPNVAGSPALSDADHTSVMMYEGQMLRTAWETGYEAVSALLMKQQFNFDFSIEDIILAETEMIISFPTKPFYFQGEELMEPFLGSNWPPAFLSCEFFNFYLYNRDTKPIYTVPGGVSPRPPILCAHSNGMKVTSPFNVDRQYLDILGFSQGFYGLWAALDDNGMVKISFEQSTSRGRSTNDEQVHVYHGLPFIGMHVLRYTNAAAQVGLLAKYGFAFELNGQRKIEVINPL